MSEAEFQKCIDYWTKTVLKDFEKLKKSPKLRESVWKFGIPKQLRGKVWPLAIGNSLMMTQNLYSHFAQRAKQVTEARKKAAVSKNKDNSDNTKDKDNSKDSDKDESKKQELTADIAETILLNKETTISYIGVDIPRTFPELAYFQDEGILNDTLRVLLQTYCFYRPDIGYVQGMSYLAATLLLYMDDFTAFKSLCNLLNSPFFHDFLKMKIDSRSKIFEKLLKYNEIEIYNIFISNMIRPEQYFMDWAMTLFSRALKLSVVPRIWDLILMFGEIEVYRCSVAILKCLKNEILNKDIDVVRKKIQKQLPNVCVLLCLLFSLFGWFVFYKLLIFDFCCLFYFILIRH